MRLLFLLGVAFGVAWGTERFDGSRLYSLKIKSLSDLEKFSGLEEKYDVWKLPRVLNENAHIMVRREKVEEFEKYLKSSGIEFEIINYDIQKTIDEQNPRMFKKVSKMEWKNYHRLQEIYDWLDELAAKNPEVNTVIGGKTYEGRKIKGIEINFGQNLTGVFLEAGIHAREWASPASTTWMVNEIIKSPQNSVFRKFNYVYFPLFNPDGYEYSWTKNRLWRKTRKPYNKGNEKCFGADPNRNWDFRWNKIGTSNDPCSEIYAGPHAFSEIEMKTLSDYIKSIKVPKKIDIYITYHTYSQLLLYPWGDSRETAPQKPFWDKVGAAAAKAHEAVHKMVLRYGQGAVILYPTSGASDDWFYGNYNATIAFTMEMRDTGRHGFLLPPEQIIPNAEEHFAALKAILEEYLKHKK